MRDEIQPLLTKFAIRRTGENTLPGHYDPDRQVWVVDTANGLKPLVECDQFNCLAELMTKTDAVPEKDDISLSGLLELMTKTMKEAERDDIGPRSWSTGFAYQ